MQTQHSIDDLISIGKRGIRSRYEEGAPKKVLIVGAGVAGLSAAYELKRAGHVPVILEAQQRVGGRVHTLRQPFADGLYADVGAMRIPRAHALTMYYIEKFGLSTNDFTMDNPRAHYYLGGRKVRAADANASPALLGFDVSEREIGRIPGGCTWKLSGP